MPGGSRSQQRRLRREAKAAAKAERAKANPHSKTAHYVATQVRVHVCMCERERERARVRGTSLRNSIAGRAFARCKQACALASACVGLRLAWGARCERAACGERVWWRCRGEQRR